MTSPPDRVVVAAFVVFVIFAGANAIGVRFVLREMGPFWSAAIYIGAVYRPKARLAEPEAHAART